jgi:hypothetical protein
LIGGRICDLYERKRIDLLVYAFGALWIAFAPREKGEDLAEGSGRFTRDPATAGARS